jgi:hypothetical protein
MLDLPDTDSSDVMEMAIALWLSERVWDQVARAVHGDDAEEMLVAIYDRVFKAVRKTHGG